MMDQITEADYAEALLNYADADDDYIHETCRKLAADALRHPMYRGMFCDDLHVVFDDGNIDLARSCADTAVDRDAKAILSRMAELDWPHRVLVMVYIDRIRVWGSGDDE